MWPRWKTFSSNMAIAIAAILSVTMVTAKPTDSLAGQSQRSQGYSKDVSDLKYLLSGALSGTDEENLKVVELVLQLLSEIDLPTLCEVIINETKQEKSGKPQPKVPVNEAAFSSIEDGVSNGDYAPYTSKGPSSERFTTTAFQNTFSTKGDDSSKGLTSQNGNQWQSRAFNEDVAIEPLKQGNYKDDNSPYNDFQDSITSDGTLAYPADSKRKYFKLNRGGPISEVGRLKQLKLNEFYAGKSQKFGQSEPTQGFETNDADQIHFESLAMKKPRAQLYSGALVLGDWIKNDDSKKIELTNNERQVSEDRKYDETDEVHTGEVVDSDLLNAKKLPTERVPLMTPFGGGEIIQRPIRIRVARKPDGSLDRSKILGRVYKVKANTFNLGPDEERVFPNGRLLKRRIGANGRSSFDRALPNKIYSRKLVKDIQNLDSIAYPTFIYDERKEAAEENAVDPTDETSNKEDTVKDTGLEYSKGFESFINNLEGAFHEYKVERTTEPDSFRSSGASSSSIKSDKAWTTTSPPENDKEDTAAPVFEENNKEAKRRELFNDITVSYGDNIASANYDSESEEDLTIPELVYIGNKNDYSTHEPTSSSTKSLDNQPFTSSPSKISETQTSIGPGSESTVVLESTSSTSGYFEIQDKFSTPSAKSSTAQNSPSLSSTSFETDLVPEFATTVFESTRDQELGNSDYDIVDDESTTEYNTRMPSSIAGLEFTSTVTDQPEQYQDENTFEISENEILSTGDDIYNKEDEIIQQLITKFSARNISRSKEKNSSQETSSEITSDFTLNNTHDELLTHANESNLTEDSFQIPNTTELPHSHDRTLINSTDDQVPYNSSIKQNVSLTTNTTVIPGLEGDENKMNETLGGEQGAHDIKEDVELENIPETTISPALEINTTKQEIEEANVTAVPEMNNSSAVLEEKVSLATELNDTDNETETNTATIQSTYTTSVPEREPNKKNNDTDLRRTTNVVLETESIISPTPVVNKTSINVTENAFESSTENTTSIDNNQAEAADRFPEHLNDALKMAEALTTNLNDGELHIVNYRTSDRGVETVIFEHKKVTEKFDQPTHVPYAANPENVSKLAEPSVVGNNSSQNASIDEEREFVNAENSNTSTLTTSSFNSVTYENVSSNINIGQTQDTMDTLKDVNANDTFLLTKNISLETTTITYGYFTTNASTVEELPTTSQANSSILIGENYTRSMKELESEDNQTESSPLVKVESFAVPVAESRKKMDRKVEIQTLEPISSAHQLILDNISNETDIRSPVQANNSTLNNIAPGESQNPYYTYSQEEDNDELLLNATVPTTRKTEGPATTEPIIFHSPVSIDFGAESRKHLENNSDTETDPILRKDTSSMAYDTETSPKTTQSIVEDKNSTAAESTMSITFITTSLEPETTDNASQISTLGSRSLEKVEKEGISEEPETPDHDSQTSTLSSSSIEKTDESNTAESFDVVPEEESPIPESLSQENGSSEYTKDMNENLTLDYNLSESASEDEDMISPIATVFDVTADAVVDVTNATGTSLPLTNTTKEVISEGFTNNHLDSAAFKTEDKAGENSEPMVEYEDESAKISNSNETPDEELEHTFETSPGTTLTTMADVIKTEIDAKISNSNETPDEELEHTFETSPGTTQTTMADVIKTEIDSRDNDSKTKPLSVDETITEKPEAKYNYDELEVDSSSNNNNADDLVGAYGLGYNNDYGFDHYQDGSLYKSDQPYIWSLDALPKNNEGKYTNKPVAVPYSGLFSEWYQNEKMKQPQQTNYDGISPWKKLNMAVGQEKSGPYRRRMSYQTYPEPMNGYLNYAHGYGTPFSTVYNQVPMGYNMNPSDKEKYLWNARPWPKYTYSDSYKRFERNNMLAAQENAVDAKTSEYNRYDAPDNKFAHDTTWGNRFSQGFYGRVLNPHTQFDLKSLLQNRDTEMSGSKNRISQDFRNPEPIAEVSLPTRSHTKTKSYKALNSAAATDKEDKYSFNKDEIQNFVDEVLEGDEKFGKSLLDVHNEGSRPVELSQTVDKVSKKDDLTVGVPAPGAIDCKGMFGYHPDPENCQAFFICSWGVPHRIYCPAGTLWNRAQMVCDWAVNVDC